MEQITHHLAVASGKLFGKMDGQQVRLFSCSAEIQIIEHCYSVPVLGKGRITTGRDAALSAKARADCFAELSVEEFKVVETLDGHTCEKCGSMDGKHFPMDKYEIGVTAPPFHPCCRGTTCPHFKELKGYGKRVARDLKGRTFYLPADTTYQEWKKMQDEQFGARKSIFKTRKNRYHIFITKRTNDWTKSLIYAIIGI